MKNPHLSAWRNLALMSWGFCLFVGFLFLLRYSCTAGPPANARRWWPTHTHLERSTNAPTLLVFAHPHCPCSQATLGELERLAPYLAGKVQVIVSFYKPQSRSATWVEQGLWSQAARIPGVTNFIDEEGAESDLFGAKTSGQVMLYSTAGELVFEGGITPARGHSGDNVGRFAIISYIEAGKASVNRSAVFGCSLKNPERAVAGGNQ